MLSLKSVKVINLIEKKSYQQPTYRHAVQHRQPTNRHALQSFFYNRTPVMWQNYIYHKF